MMPNSRIWLLIPLLFLVGCGYSFSGQAERVSSNGLVIALNVKDSVSTIPGFQWSVLEEMKNILLRNYGYRIGGREEADLLLSIDITRVQKDPSGYVAKKVTVSGKEYNYPVLGSAYLRISMDIKLTDTRKQEVVWSDSRVEQKELYNISEDPLRTSYNLNQALSKILERTAAMIYGSGLTRF